MARSQRTATLLVLSSVAAFGASAEPAGESARLLETVTVVGAAGGVENVAGSASYLSPEDLDTLGQSDVLRILRDVPGVNIQEEEGYGLRPNIGLRGSGSDRSSRVALMEDSVPIAPAPYASPSAYYFPSAGRIHAVEVTKGPAAIKYGPRTTGGAVNLFSTPVPDAASAYAEFLAGDFARQRLHAWAGTRAPVASGLEAGVLIETYQDEADGFLRLDGGGETGFDVSDYVVKAGLYGVAGPRPWTLELKYQTRDEVSDQTYLGLTDADFAADPYRLYITAQDDRMSNENELLQLTGRVDLSDTLSLTAIAYNHDFARSWYKLQGISADGTGAAGDTGLTAIVEDPDTFAAEFALLTGAASLEDSIVIRDNNRVYYSRGVKAAVNWTPEAFGAAHDITFGLRLHEDEEDRFQQEDAYRLDAGGDLALTTAGAPGSQANRVSTGEALALFVEDRIRFDRWQVNAGLRFEDFELRREDYSTSDPTRGLGPQRVRENSDSVVLPAIGVLYDASEALTLLAGAHRGFAVPAPGNTASDAEESWNYEAGARFVRGDLAVEAIAYLNAYENLLGDCTASSGGGCTIGDQFDGGAVDVTGLELTARWDAAPALGLGEVSVPVGLVYTLTDTEFQSSFASEYEAWGDVEAGDALPYVPEHQVTLRAGVEGGRFGVHVSGNYQDESRATAGQGAIPADQLIDSRWVVDAAAFYEIADGVRLKAQVENLFDEVYAAARRPSGLRPGKPQEVLLGLELSF